MGHSGKKGGEKVGKKEGEKGFYYYSNNYFDMVCCDLIFVFTAENAARLFS